MTGVGPTGRVPQPPVPPQGRTEVLEPLSLAAVTAVLDARGERYVVTDQGEVGARWGRALIRFVCTGERSEILHIRVNAERRLPAGRRLAAYGFCNAWNHDRLLPAAYVHDDGDGELIVSGEINVDLEHGVSPAQLAVLVHAAIASGVGLAEAVEELPD